MGHGSGLQLGNFVQGALLADDDWSEELAILQAWPHSERAQLTLLHQ